MNVETVISSGYLSDRDTDTEHVCGTCGQLKPVTEFYKDGKDRHGKIRYRRDCKDCYKYQRMQEATRKARKEAKQNDTM